MYFDNYFAIFHKIFFITGCFLFLTQLSFSRSSDYGVLHCVGRFLVSIFSYSYFFSTLSTTVVVFAISTRDISNSCDPCQLLGLTGVPFLFPTTLLSCQHSWRVSRSICLIVRLRRRRWGRSLYRFLGTCPRSSV